MKSIAEQDKERYERMQPKRVSPAIAEFIIQEKAQQMKAVRVVECSDERAARLVQLFQNMDARGKLVLLRMAESMPGAE